MKPEDPDKRHTSSQTENKLKYPPNEHDPHVELTCAGQRYFETADSTINLFHFFAAITLRGDYTRFVAEQVLSNVEPEKLDDDYKDYDPVTLAEKSPGPHTKYLRKHRQEFLEIVLCRLVDNFNTFLSEIVREALASRPEMLKSQESIRIDYLMSFESREDLIEDLVDRKVADLSYGGFNSLNQWIEDRMGIRLEFEESFQSDIVELLETRNAIVHNRGCVGAKYLRLVNNSRFQLGAVRRLVVDDVLNALGALNEFASVVDSMVAEKFGLQREARLNLSTHD